MNKLDYTKDELEWYKFLQVEFKSVKPLNVLDKDIEPLIAGFVWQTKAKKRKPKILKERVKVADKKQIEVRAKYVKKTYKWRGKCHNRKKII